MLIAFAVGTLTRQAVFSHYFTVGDGCFAVHFFLYFIFPLVGEALARLPAFTIHFFFFVSSFVIVGAIFLHFSPPPVPLFFFCPLLSTMGRVFRP